MSFLRNVCFGTLAGLAGSGIMHGFRLVWEGVAARDSRDTVFGFDREADVNAARLTCGLFSNQIPSDRQAARLGIAMHYAFGPMLGVLYAVLRCKSSVLFGVLLWLLADEIPVTALRISDPREKNPASHASALAAHLLFGITIETTLRALLPDPGGSRF